MDSNIPVEISPKLQKQIKWLCDKISTVEWSGTLFYRIEGSFMNNDFKIIAEELYLQDIGTGGYTEYEYGVDFAKYMMKNPRLKEYRRGHIHSHNNMGVFFSGTDVSELVSNSPNYNYYFSLIVNNRNDMEARVAFSAIVKSKTIETIVYKGDEGEDKFMECESSSDETKTYYFDCDITKPEIFENDNTITELQSRHTELKAKETSGSRFRSTYDYEDDSKDSWKRKSKSRSIDGNKATRYSQTDVWSGRSEGYINTSDDYDYDNDYYTGRATTKPLFKTQKQEYEDNIERFASQVILNDKYGHSVLGFDDLKSVILNIERRKTDMSDSEWKKFLSEASKNVTVIYDQVFDDPYSTNFFTILREAKEMIMGVRPVGTTDLCNDLIKIFEQV